MCYEDLRRAWIYREKSFSSWTKSFISRRVGESPPAAPVITKRDILCLNLKCCSTSRSGEKHRRQTWKSFPSYPFSEMNRVNSSAFFWCHRPISFCGFHGERARWRFTEINDWYLKGRRALKRSPRNTSCLAVWSIPMGPGCGIGIRRIGRMHESCPGWGAEMGRWN